MSTVSDIAGMREKLIAVYRETFLLPFTPYWKADTLASEEIDRWIATIRAEARDARDQQWLRRFGPGLPVLFRLDDGSTYEWVDDGWRKRKDQREPA